MNLATVFLWGMITFLFGVLGFGAYKFWDRGFRNVAHIARQTGNDVNDVIWIRTRFKVINRDGSWTIVFRHLTETMGSIEGRFWTKFIKPRKTFTVDNKNWAQRDYSRLIQRGLYLYESSEGVFFPMKIEHKDDNVKFNIFDQDNRLFLISEIEHTNSLTRDRRRELVGIVALIIGVVVLAVVIFGGMYWIHKESQDGIAKNAAICSEYIRTAFNITSNSNPTFFNQIPLPGG